MVTTRLEEGTDLVGLRYLAVELGKDAVYFQRGAQDTFSDALSQCQGFRAHGSTNPCLLRLGQTLELFQERCDANQPGYFAGSWRELHLLR